MAASIAHAPPPTILLLELMDCRLLADDDAVIDFDEGGGDPVREIAGHQYILQSDVSVDVTVLPQIAQHEHEVEHQFEHITVSTHYHLREMCAVMRVKRIALRVIAHH